MSDHEGRQSAESNNGKKRKWQNSRQQFGSKGKARDLASGSWSRQRLDKRSQNEESAAKRRKTELNGKDSDKNSVLPKPFTDEEIAAEERRPKHKVAVMIGYSGSGYHGMQINTTERTIEGDLFSAFVAAGAISKANANDPKKSGLVRCARTDKGVHAAGNVVSLKLIIEDPDIVGKINSSLSPQIRIWGLLRTVGSFSCYQACDSRWYEYLIPSHSFLPPHPQSFLGKKLFELAKRADDLEGHQQRQAEVKTFWPETEESSLKPILDELDGPVKEIVQKALYETEDDDPPSAAYIESEETNESINTTDNFTDSHTKRPDRRTLDGATKRLRAAIHQAKRAHRISDERLARLRETLNYFIGTHKFHNYTIEKTASDPSAKRHIKSITLDPAPKLINGTEWLSIKIHGQSFMMHQIRKMISAAALIVRCGCDPSRIQDTFEPNPPLSIPKVPGLGLLLERPVFESYNNGPAEKFGRPKIDFQKYEEEMEAFKQREIYERIFREEEEGSAFLGFWGHVDGFKGAGFLWVSSVGVSATREDVGISTNPPPRIRYAREEDEDEANDHGEVRVEEIVDQSAVQEPYHEKKEASVHISMVDSEDESDAEESKLRNDNDG